MSTDDLMYAPAELRDRFLNAVDARDDALCDRLAFDLKTCMNPLPGLTCQQLGLPIGSTYGSAARHILGTSHEQQSRYLPAEKP
ncbi:MAG: hypothetical protein GEV05_20045 [Betaproteobacteria bacterium]|nr:hypothetical protein [Betaproteobacteria bacterium]